MPVSDLVARHGSPLWLVNLDVLRDRWRTLASTWQAVWDDVHIAYAHAANRHPAVVEALAAAGAGHYVSSEPDYLAARALTGGDGRPITVHGAGLSEALLARAAGDGALVIADSAQELEKATAAGAARLGIRVASAAVGHGPSVFGVAVAEATSLASRRRAGAHRLQALAVHIATSGFSRPAAEVKHPLGEIVAAWPLPAERYAAAARALASLAVRLGVPVVDVGGGYPPAPDEMLYARAVGGALGTVGFDGRLMVEPGRAAVGEAVDLACTVLATKRLADGTECAVVDAGQELVPGILWRWAHVDLAGKADGVPRPTMVVGPRTRSHDVIHPAAKLPPLSEGDVLVLRRVGAYNQSESTDHAGRQAHVVVGEGGGWRSLDASPISS